MKVKQTLGAVAMALLLFSPAINAEKLVILHTNDTHSQIDPSDNGEGGVLRRKVLIDSVKQAEKNVIVVDAGDVVQGTLYFNLYKGEVEEKLMNALGYELRILGNHEFDNGMEALATNLKMSNAELLSTNYDLDKSTLKGMFKKFTIREYDGKKIGFIAINLDPKGMIAEGNYDGVVYRDAIETANATAAYLKKVEGVDMVVALSHIGYTPQNKPSDVDLAKASTDIDVIIGGHSHTLIYPGVTDETTPYLIPNANGKNVLVAQTRRRGAYLGEITIDLDNLTPRYRLIEVNSRLDDRIDPLVAQIIKPYSAGVDSLMALKVATSAIKMAQDEEPILNFASDFMLYQGQQLADNVDFSIMNRGGLRRALPKGDITEGMIKMLMPFKNVATVIDIKGADLIPAFDEMARVGGNGVSYNVEATYSTKTNKCIKIKINGQVLDPDKTYRVATLDYLANGGDYMQTLTRGTVVARSSNVVYDDMLNYLRQGPMKGKKIKPSAVARMRAIE
jgi:5'-nucleotidase